MDFRQVHLSQSDSELPGKNENNSDNDDGPAAPSVSPCSSESSNRSHDDDEQLNAGDQFMGPQMK